MLIVDGHGSVRACGESVADTLGRDADELEGLPVWTVIPGWSPFDTTPLECSLRPPGLRTSIPVKVSCEALHVLNDTLFLLDVRPRRAAAPGSSAGAVMVTDRHGEILYVNVAFEAMTGYCRAELAGRTPAVLNSGLHPSRVHRELWTTILDGRVFRGALVNRRRNGEFYHETKVIRPVSDGDGRPALFLCSSRELAVPGLWRGASAAARIGA